MAFDVATNQLILLASDHTTWSWSGDNWVELRTLAPQGEAYGDLVYDKAHEQLLLWAGNETWIFKAGKWSRVAIPPLFSPPPASSARTSPPAGVDTPPVASGTRLQPPSPPAGLSCRIPYADISEASGG